MSDLDVLRDLGRQVVPPPIEALAETAHRRDRRARIATGLVVAVAATVVTAVVVLVGRDPGRDVEPAPPPAPTTRPLTYADGSTITYGDRTVEAAGPVVELDVTDDGVGFRTEDGHVWFTDGSEVERLGELGRTGPGYDDAWPLMNRPSWMLSGNAGSRLAWFEFPSPGAPEVVVYDTRSRTEVARDAVRLGPGGVSLPALVTDRFVYWFQDPDPGAMGADQSQVRYDPATGEQRPVTEADVLKDLDADAAPRSVRLKGDARSEHLRGFHFSDGAGLQMGLDLRQDVAGASGIAPVGPGDMVARTVDGKPFAFEPPPGYTGGGAGWLVQWLDDRTVVVMSTLPTRTDLLACDLDTSACQVAASGPATIVVPDFGASQLID
ncbi:MAG TPA: hypothetical protein VGD39_04020 [Nocardioides sp.]